MHWFCGKHHNHRHPLLYVVFSNVAIRCAIIAHIIFIIKSEVSNFPIVIIFSLVVCLRCLLHYILALIAYTFRANPEFVFIMIVLFMMSANIRIRFALHIVFICLYITPSHRCGNLSEDIKLIKCLSDILCRVYYMTHILSAIHYTICGAVWFQFTHFLCDDWENIWNLSYYHNQIGSLSYYPLFRVRPWNNCMFCMSFYILIGVLSAQWSRNICFFQQGKRSAWMTIFCLLILIPGFYIYWSSNCNEGASLAWQRFID